MAIRDHFIWKEDNGKLISTTYDYKTRLPRQKIKPTFLENGSIYVLKTSVLLENNNRLGGKIVNYPMDPWKSFQIDEVEDIEICEYYMNKNIL